MKRSKIDRLGIAFGTLVRDRMSRHELDLRRRGLTASADAVKDCMCVISNACQFPSQYERLEIDDIIKGHKRAWPE